MMWQSAELAVTEIYLRFTGLPHTNTYSMAHADSLNCLRRMSDDPLLELFTLGCLRDQLIEFLRRLVHVAIAL